jgi:UDP-N-acetylglucosamine--N-acetylmuramyl-(pentapeptide) pyrophosphoryl-undecaprenol N-acetylglucosamine transferase
MSDSPAAQNHPPLGSTNVSRPIRLLVAASGTGGHLFPALAIANTLEIHGYQVEWMGVSDRLETQLVPKKYPLHYVEAEGFQSGGLKALGVLVKFIRSVGQTRRLLKHGQFDAVLTTGGYIAAPAIIAARTLGRPSILHESNALPGKVTRGLSRWCTVVALGFDMSQRYLPKAQSTRVVGTPVRDSFFHPAILDLPIPAEAPLIVAVGGSQGAVGLNRLVRQAAPAWLEAGAWIVHVTGDRDSDADQFQHPHYLRYSFFENMAGLFQRADLAISRSGAGTLAELAMTGTPSILIPYPYAAEDHQAVNASVFVEAEAGLMFREGKLDPVTLQQVVQDLITQPDRLAQMATKTKALAVPDSTERVVQLVEQVCQSRD